MYLYGVSCSYKPYINKFEATIKKLTTMRLFYMYLYLQGIYHIKLSDTLKTLPYIMRFIGYHTGFNVKVCNHTKLIVKTCATLTLLMLKVHAMIITEDHWCIQRYFIPYGDEHIYFNKLTEDIKDIM